MNQSSCERRTEPREARTLDKDYRGSLLEIACCLRGLGKGAPPVMHSPEALGGRPGVMCPLPNLGEDVRWKDGFRPHGELRSISEITS